MESIRSRRPERVGIPLVLEAGTEDQAVEQRVGILCRVDCGMTHLLLSQRVCRHDRAVNARGDS